MDPELTELQKAILWLALKNRGESGVTFRKVVKKRVVETITEHGVSRDHYEHEEIEPSIKNWLDIEQSQVLRECFGITYTPTFEEDSGLYTPARESKESKEYRRAADAVKEAIADLDLLGLAGWCLTGPRSWSGFPQRYAAVLTDKGVELARRLGQPSALQGESPSGGAAGTAHSGASASPEGKARRLTPVSEFVEMLKYEDASMRLAGATALREIGRDAREAIPALEAALEDDDLGVRLMARWALDAIRRDA